MSGVLHPRSRADVESDFAKILSTVTSSDPRQIKAAAMAVAERVPAEYVDANTAAERILVAAPEAVGDELRALKKAIRRGYRRGAYHRAIAPLEPVSKLVEAHEYEEKKRRRREDRQIRHELDDEGNDRPPIAEAMLGYDELMNQPPLRSLVPGMLNIDTVALLYAPPATFKTFLALWVGACVALGHPWAGRPVEPGPVLYIAAEGVAGIQKRVAALAWHLNGGAPIPNFYIYPAPVNLTSEADVAEISELVADRGFRLVVLDTLVKVAGGAEENDNTAMTRVTNAAERIKRAGEGETTVLLVHHSGKSGDYRGASALEGNVDTMLKLEGEAGMLTLSAVKQKDGESGQIIRLRAKPIAEHDTLVLEPIAPGTAQPSSVQAARIEESLAHFIRLFSETGATRPQFSDALVELEVGGRSTVYSYVNELVKSKQLIVTGSASRQRLDLPKSPAATFPVNQPKKSKEQHHANH